MAIVAIEAVKCADPNESFPVLDDGAHFVVGKSVGGGDVIEKSGSRFLCLAVFDKGKRQEARYQERGPTVHILSNLPGGGSVTKPL